MPEFKIHVGDCLQTMRAMPDNSVDSIVTDPPYGLSFMGKKWDYDVPTVEIWVECLRVLKPGGHLLAFAGTRTQHRMAVRIEDAGFEIRDMIAWVYGSGFPKSRNIGNDVDGMDGWGTALKPALEPVTLARKPLIGTVAANVRAHGTGAINIGACRIETDENLNGGAYATQGGRSESQSLHGASGMNVAGKTAGKEFEQPTGRWPANLIHDGSAEVFASFPEAPGQIAAASTSDTQRAGQNVYGNMKRGRGSEASANSENVGVVGFQMKPGARRLDSGSAARFFYCAKTSKKDRNDGLDAFPETTTKTFEGGKIASGKTPDSMGGERTSRNNHPTVKPTGLMAYLLRLVTPPGGTALDPFMGSGSTGKAAMREGFKFIGCEIDEQYAAIARARIEHEAGLHKSRKSETDQIDLFATT